MCINIAQLQMFFLAYQRIGHPMVQIEKFWSFKAVAFLCLGNGPCHKLLLSCHFCSILIM